MTARRKARRRTLDVLFEAEARGLPVMEVLRERIRLGAAGIEAPIPEYAARLVEAIEERRARIDELISTYAVGWTLERMPAVDRNLLRIGAYELLWADDVPDGVAISEAVALAGELSTDDSPAFVNGLLGRLLEVKEPLLRGATPRPPNR